MTRYPTEAIAFAPVTTADLPLLGAWMARPHWREWWGDPKIELGYVRDMVEGRDETCRPFLFSVGGAPAGYIQVWRIAPHQTEEWTIDTPWLADVPSDAVGIDLSIADEERLSRGLGSAVIRAFVARLRGEGCRVILIDPDPANGRAVAAYRKAGFRPIPHLAGRTGDVLIMQFHQDDTLT